jgi:hypothetical protein
VGKVLEFSERAKSFEEIKNTISTNFFGCNCTFST